MKEKGGSILVVGDDWLDMGDKNLNLNFRMMLLSDEGKTRLEGNQNSYARDNDIEVTV